MLHCSYNKNIEKLLFENFHLTAQQQDLKLIKSNDLLFLKSSTSTTVFTHTGHFFKIQPEDHTLLEYNEEKSFQITMTRYGCDIPTTGNYEIDLCDWNKRNSNSESQLEGKDQIRNVKDLGSTNSCQLDNNSYDNDLKYNNSNQLENYLDFENKLKNADSTQLNNNSDDKNVPGYNNSNKLGDSTQLSSNSNKLGNSQNKFKFTVQDSLSEFTSVKILSNEKNLGFLFISENRRITRILKEMFKESGIEEFESENNANEIWTVIQALKNLKKI